MTGWLPVCVLAFITTRPTPTTWEEPPNIVVGAITDDVTVVEGRAAILRAVAAWDEVGALPLRVADEGPIRVEWRAPWPEEFGRNATAVTTTSTRGAAIVDATVALNDQHFRWTAADDPGRHRIEVVALHELGHALGLSHSTRRDAAMYWHYTADAALSDDDRRGLRYLYGEREPGQLCDSCEVPADCESGLCVTLGDGRGQCATPCDCPPQFTCVQLAGGGDACVPRNQSCTDRAPGDLQEGTPCWGPVHCGPGLQCVVTPESATCQRICQTDDDCPDGLLCARNDGGPLACGPPGPRENGAGCVDPYECESLACVGARCDGPEPEPDAAVDPDIGLDAQPPDAAPPDAATPDLGPPDVPVPDQGFDFSMDLAVPDVDAENRPQTAANDGCSNVPSPLLVLAFACIAGRRRADRDAPPY